MSTVASIHREQILQRVSKGEYLKDIAASLNVSKQAISQVLKDDPEYQQAMEEGMAARLDNAHSLLAEITEDREINGEKAKELLDIARIREIGIRRLEWRAEREFPRRWAAKTEHKQDMSLSITVNRGQSEGNVIEVTDTLRKLPSNPLITVDSDPT